ncbi:MAG TPA: hypothetical protein VJ831_09085 [Jatrophihabitantaceae bacterium]|nr:hypothetical protein [Jatrophihabitantaceae bacterium]
MRRNRWLRRLKERRAIISVAAVVVLLAALVALFINQYNGTGDPGKDVAVGGPSGSVVSPSASGSSSASSSAPGVFKGISGLPTGRPSTRDKFGNLIQPRAVTMTVTSNTTLFRVGYLVPTSLDSPYGSVSRGVRSWTLTVHATGKSPVAAVFIQAGASGTVSCTISIDGQLADSKSTTKAYERNLCVA